jgi:hypothetical protein
MYMYIYHSNALIIKYNVVYNLIRETLNLNFRKKSQTWIVIEVAATINC